ncbi:hypothetical protein KSD_93870 [Ktedonobacter sp. SOSP1-85]|nr:hypothetical protein KSD_93870 [Ktedonobacter sp. SOSP1-85]
MKNAFKTFFLVYHVPARYATEALYTPEFTRTQPIPHLLIPAIAMWDVVPAEHVEIQK